MVAVSICKLLELPMHSYQGLNMFIKLGLFRKDHSKNARDYLLWKCILLAPRTVQRESETGESVVIIYSEKQGIFHTTHGHMM